MDQKKTGSFLRELRKEKGLTQEQLSEALGVTGRSISRWENGTNMPGIDLVIEIANYYDISIEELLDGERKRDMIDKKTEEVVLKVADYNNDENMTFTKKLGRIFIIALAAYGVYMILEIQGLTGSGVYENVADFALGIILGALLLGVLYTSRYRGKIQAFKQRMLKRNRHERG